MVKSIKPVSNLNPKFWLIESVGRVELFSLWKSNVVNPTVTFYDLQRKSQQM